MFREGEINVRLALREHRIDSVDIMSTRAALPRRLTQGRTAAEVARTLPLLFSVCAKAQGAAAASATEAASGHAPDRAALACRCDEVRRETVVELLTRLLIDWPRALGALPDVVSVARARQAKPEDVLATCHLIAAQRVYGVVPSRWLEQASLESLERWASAASTLPAQSLQRLQREAADLGRSDVGAMPSATADALFHVLPSFDGEPGFCRTPDWLGAPVETGALARRARHPLVAAYTRRDGNTVPARFVAQLVDLALWLAPDRDEAAPAVRQYAAAAGTGIGVAETARGLLLHQAAVVDGKVEHYRIIAPTEWNFHPAGAATQGLLHRPVSDAETARRDAGWLVQALDPCVAFAIEVADA